RSWSTSDAAARQFAYWKEQLRDAVALFPTDGHRGRALSNLRVAHEPVYLPKDLAARLSMLSRRQGSTLFMTLLAGFKAQLLARSGRNDICIATSMANRSQLTTERVIGPLANTTIIRTRIDADLSFQEALSRVRISVLDALANQELPYDILADRLA